MSFILSTHIRNITVSHPFGNRASGMQSTPGLGGKKKQCMGSLARGAQHPLENLNPSACHSRSDKVAVATI